MPIPFLILLILAVVAVILWVVRHTRAQVPHQSYVAPMPLDRPLTLKEAEQYCDEGELVCKPHYLRYVLTEAYEVEDKQLGLFVGYAKADPQRNEDILVVDSCQLVRGRIASQPKLYEQLIASRRATCYGVVHKGDRGYEGEVCIRTK